MVEHQRMVSDANLLAGYVSGQDEAAFAALVDRHGGMVYRVCLRVTSNETDAEDAAQATFFVLMQKAAKLKPSGNLAAWLHGVARRAGLAAVKARRRRQRREQEAGMERHRAAATKQNAISKTEKEEILTSLDSAIVALPKKLRQAVVLRYLEGHSQAAAAVIANCPKGTLGWRAKKGIEALRERLSRSGKVLSGGVLLTVLSAEAQAAPPAAMCSTILAGSSTTATGAAGASGTQAALFTKGVVQMMLMNKILTGVAIAFLLLGATVVGVVGSGKQVAASEQGWTLKYNFNKGKVGDRVAKWDAAGRTRYTKEQWYEGGQAVEMNAKRGKENWGSWGGRIFFPKQLKKGDELWWRVRTYWPKGVDYSANPKLKFLRVHTATAKGKNAGYCDVLLNGPTSKVPFYYSYEGDAKPILFGKQADGIKHDVWETYEFYVKFDDKSVDDGGQARARFWKNGKLMLDATNSKTLKGVGDYADDALIFTYWNSSPWQAQIMLKEGADKFKVGEKVISDANPKHIFTVQRIVPGAIFLGSLPNKDWRKVISPRGRVKTGSKLVGQTSKHTAVVTEALLAFPTMDIKMFVDDIVLTTKTPKGRDAKGNPFIGVGKRQVVNRAKTGNSQTQP